MTPKVWPEGKRNSAGLDRIFSSFRGKTTILKTASEVGLGRLLLMSSGVNAGPRLVEKSIRSQRNVGFSNPWLVSFKASLSKKSARQTTYYRRVRGVLK